MKIIIAGSRDYTDYDVLCNEIQNSGFIIDEIVSGCAKGVDRMGERYSFHNNIKLKQFPAEWDRYGRAAGPIRNKQMAEYADALIAIMRSKSKGTRNNFGKTGC